MKEQLIALLTSKVGLDPEKAQQAVDTVLDYIRSNPDQIKSYLSQAGIGAVGDKLSSLLG
jgi:nucleoid DNA-binding protein